MSKPIAVLISDIHYNIHTLPLADAAMRLAITKANDLNVPLIVAGDLHDTKANLRGECVNAMIETFKLLNSLDSYILRGNHDAINEKSKEHSLMFLQDIATIVDEPGWVNVGHKNKITINLIPYQHDPEVLKSYLKTLPKESLLIMHQGVQTSNSGHYIQDKSALPKECFKDFRVISGHYHTRQDIKCGPPKKGAVGLFSYIGNPYTLNYAEANDPPKGFQVLMDDGTLAFVPTNLRKHVVYEIDLSNNYHPAIVNHSIHDLIYLKVKGTREQLENYKKPFNCRLDLIPIEAETSKNVKQENVSQVDLYDSLIDSLTNTEDKHKIRLKSIWKDFISENS